MLLQPFVITTNWFLNWILISNYFYQVLCHAKVVLLGKGTICMGESKRTESLFLFIHFLKVTFELVVIKLSSKWLWNS